MGRLLGWEVGRVAGESRVEVLLDGDSVRVTYSSVSSLRGFERLALGRRVGDLPLIASRICGVCSHPHFWAAALAAEQVAGVEASEDTRVLRDVCNKLSLVQNHVIHLGVLALPDHLSREDSERVSRKALELSGHLVRAMRNLCGRLTSPSCYSMGRFLLDIDRRVLSSTAELLKSSLTALDELVARVLDVGLPDTADPAPRYAALSGSTRVTVPSGRQYRVDTPAGRFSVAPENYRELFGELHAEYSSSRKCLFMGSPFYVGPRARLLAAIRSGDLDGEVKDYAVGLERALEENPFSNIYAKAIESKMALSSAIRDLRELSSRDLRLTPSVVSKGEPAGLGIVEAPRGLLIHYYEVDREGRVVGADIVTPTVMNAEHIELSSTAMVKRLLSEGAGDAAVQRLVESLVRSYDPCIPCAVHVVRLR